MTVKERIHLNLSRKDAKCLLIAISEAIEVSDGTIAGMLMGEDLAQAIKMRERLWRLLSPSR